MVMPLPAWPWPFNLISMSQAQVHTRPNSGEIISNSYKDTVFTRFFALILTFDLLTQKLISTSMSPFTHVTKIGYNSLHWFSRYGVHWVFGSLSAITLISDLFTPKFNHHIYKPKYTCDQNCVKFPSLVFEIWCSQGFWDAQTRTLTRVRPIPVSGMGHRPIPASIGGYRYRPIPTLVSAPIPVVHLPVLTVNTVACTPIVSSL